MLRMGDTSGIHKARLLQSETLGGLIHRLYKSSLGASNRIRECDCSIVSTECDHALQELAYGY